VKCKRRHKQVQKDATTKDTTFRVHKIPLQISKRMRETPETLKTPRKRNQTLGIGSYLACIAQHGLRMRIKFL